MLSTLSASCSTYTRKIHELYSLLWPPQPSRENKFPDSLPACVMPLPCIQTTADAITQLKLTAACDALHDLTLHSKSKVYTCPPDEAEAPRTAKGSYLQSQTQLPAPMAQ